VGDKLLATAADGTAVAAWRRGGLWRADWRPDEVDGRRAAGRQRFRADILAITVVFAILGSTLAALNTAVRISFAMAQDKEMPGVMGLLHGKHATPYFGIWLMVAVSAVVGSIGLLNVTALTGTTLASNIGTFVLYAVICGITFVSFAGRPEFHSIKHAVIPALGLIGNVGMLAAILGIGLTAGGVSTQATQIALGITLMWGVISAAYLVYNSRRQGKSLLVTSSPAAGD
jgi:amino acid transporter